jgi:hypothetical protein
VNNGGTPLTKYKVYWSQNDYSSPVHEIGSEMAAVSITALDGIVTGD